MNWQKALVSLIVCSESIVLNSNFMMTCQSSDTQVVQVGSIAL